MFISGIGLVDLIKSYNNPVGLEIGTRDGATSHWILQEVPDAYLYSIDPFLDYMDWCGPVTGSNDEYLKMMKYMREYMTRYTHYRCTSDDGLRFFEDNSLDFIFIDGLHTYEQVLIDCKNYWPKIKSGGIFAGHDYSAIADVRRAVDEFNIVSGLNLPVQQTDNDVWYWIKP
jgi:predicted O-methyltransferase YrrM